MYVMQNILLYTHTLIRCNNKWIQTDTNHQPNTFMGQANLLWHRHTSITLVPQQHSMCHHNTWTANQRTGPKAEGGLSDFRMLQISEISELHERCHKNSDPWRPCWHHGGLLCLKPGLGEPYKIHMKTSIHHSPLKHCTTIMICQWFSWWTWFVALIEHNQHNGRLIIGALFFWIILLMPHVLFLLLH